MKKLLFGLLLFLSITPAVAQNPTCPTRPFGDNSNACASTAFVQAAIASISCTTTGAVSVGTGASTQCSTTGTPLFYVHSTNPTVGLSQLVAGFVTPQFLFNSETENIVATDTTLLGLRHIYNGTSGNKHTLYIESTLNGLPDAIRGFSGFQGVTQANFNGVGSSMYGLNWYNKLAAGVTGWAALLNEIDFEAQAGSSVLYKAGWAVVLGTNDAVQGTTYDAGYALGSLVNPATNYLKVGFLIGNMHGFAPLGATSAIMATTGSATILSGIDFSTYTITGALLKGTGYIVASAGSTAVTGITSGDIAAVRTATTGAYFFGTSGAQYILYDGTKFQFNGSPLTVAGGGSGAATLTGLLLGNGTSAFTGVTTSAGIAGAISDETGSGALMFGTSPVVTTDIRPASDDGVDLGTSALRWSAGFINTLTGSGQAARTWSLARNVTAATAGVDWTLQGSGAVSGGTDLAAGNVIISTGNSTGTGGTNGVSPGIIFKATRNNQQASGTTDSTPEEVLRLTNGVGNFGFMCFRGASCDATTYAITGGSGSTSTFFNASSGGSVVMRVANSTVASFSATALIFTVATDASSVSTGAIQNPGGMSVNKRVFMNGLTADTASTDNTLCHNTSTNEIMTGTGAVGICLGTSSARFKQNIESYNEGLGLVTKLQPKQFFFRDGYGDNGRRQQFGLVAEDLVKLEPRWVGLDREGKPLNVDWPNVIWALVNSVKELDRRIKR